MATLSETNGIQTKKYTFCATCGGKLASKYFTFIEDTLQGTVFYEIDGSDNVFCSKNCACSMLFLTKRYNYEEQE